MSADVLTHPSSLARLDRRVRVAAGLLAAAPRAEQALISAMAGTAALAAWPLGADVYAFAAIPAVLLLAALIRFHTDRLGARREALAAAGAGPGDLAVIQAAGPLGGTGAGALTGAIAALATGNPQAVAYLLVPLTAAAAATFLLRPAWVGAPALGAAAAAAGVASVAVVLSTPSQPGAALVASAAQAHARTAEVVSVAPGAVHAVWGQAWLPAAAALLVLGAAQVAVRKLQHHGRTHG
jgi:hypothetical protein